MSDNLKNRTIAGVGWSAADAFLGQGVSFIVGLVLARLLSPEEYGLIGIVTIFTVVMMGVVDSGFSNSLIRKKDVTDDDYSTMFITNLGLSLLLYIVLYVCAPLVARFFGRFELVDLIRVLGLVLIVQALSLVQHTILSKRIDFRTKTKASVIAAVGSGVVGISMAFAGAGVWALVGQQLSRQVLITVFLWLLNRWHPSFRFNMQSFRYMWGFGWKLMLSGLLNNIWNQFYQVVVGRCYSPATLGQYTRANECASIFSSNFTGIIQRVSYPVLSEIQDYDDRLLEVYRRVLKTTMFVTIIVMISMAAVAEPLIYCLIGSQWHKAATFLPLVCISMSFYPLHAINLNMLQIQGRTDIFLYLEIAKKVLAVIPICFGVFVNIYCMLLAGIFIDVIAFFLNSYYTGKRLRYSSWMQLNDIKSSYLLAIVIALSVYFLKYLPLSYFIILPLQVTIGIVVFFIICELFQFAGYVEVKAIAMQYMTKIKKRA